VKAQHSTTAVDMQDTETLRDRVKVSIRPSLVPVMLQCTLCTCNTAGNSRASADSSTAVSLFVSGWNHSEGSS
jgi:hypothetical protein